MNEFVMSIGRRELRVRTLWIALAVVLSGISGWQLAPSLLETASTNGRVASVFLVLVTGIITVLAHELAHSRVSLGHCRADRMAALYPTGAFPEGYVLPQSPRAELIHALAGPVGSIFTAAALASPLLLVDYDSLPGRVLLFCALANFSFAGMNLLPAMPFDGGRILRSVFWYFHDDHPTGTLIAFLYGQITSIAALAFGVFLLSWETRYLAPGLWCLLVGSMIVHASRGELLHSRMIQRAGLVPATDAIAGLNPTIRAAASVTEALDILLEQRENGPGLVRDRNRYIGTLTLQEIRPLPRAERDQTSACEIVTPFDRHIDAGKGASLLAVMRLVDENPGAIVIVRASDGEIVGLINDELSARQLLRRAEQRSIVLQQRQITGK